jgi:hypothetical protein
MPKFRILAAAAGFLLVLNMPARAQNPQYPEDISPPPVAADQAADQNEGQALAGNGQAQMLGDTDWWLENEGLTFGYLPGGFGYGGFGMGSCGGLSRPGGRGAAWWNAPGTNAWFPAGQQLPYPYGSGWCGSNYGYAPFVLTANQLVVVTGGHRHAWKHRPGVNNHKTNNQMIASASVTKAPHASASAAAGPDDDWIRVEDHIEDHVESPHVGKTAFAAGSHNQGMRQVASAGGAGRPQPHSPQGARAASARRLEHQRPAQSRAMAHPLFAAHPGAVHVAGHVAVRSGGRGHS